MLNFMRIALFVLGPALLGLTAAEIYVSQIGTAKASRPANFIVDGQNVAMVADDGRCILMSRVLTAQQTKQLRQWIKTNYVDGGSDP